MNRRLSAVMAAALGLRLIHLGFPISGIHAWRQADTAAMARAYTREGFDLLRPAVDWRGAGPGWVQSELPIYSWVMGLLGGSSVAGRLLAICGGLLAVYALYRLLRDMIDERTALWGAFLVACSPMGVYFTRTVQPDAWMFAAQVVALWLARSALTTGPRAHGPMALGAFTLACLIKPTSAVLLLPLAALVVVHRGWAGLRRPALLAGVGAASLLVVAWYAWATHLGDLTGLRFFAWAPGQDKWGHLGLALSPSFWWTILVHRLAQHALAGGLFGVLIAGLLFARNRAEELVLDLWLLSLLIGTAVTAAGQLEHAYYQLPLVGPAAAICGKVLGRHLLPSLRWQTVVLAAILATAAPSAAVHLARAYESEREHPDTLDAAALVAELVPADALVVAVAPRRDPTLLYHVDRHGWLLRPDQATPEALSDLAAQGAQYVITLHSEPIAGATLVEARGAARLYRCSPGPSAGLRRAR